MLQLYNRVIYFFVCEGGEGRIDYLQPVRRMGRGESFPRVSQSGKIGEVVTERYVHTHKGA